MAKQYAKYKIYKDRNLLIEYYFGKLDLNFLKEFKKRIISDPDYISGINCFINFKNASFNLTTQEISEFVGFIGQNSSKLGKRKLAMITNSPNQVVSTSLYKILQQDLNQSVEIFSTYEKALKWLDSDVTAQEITEFLKELKNS